MVSSAQLKRSKTGDLGCSGWFSSWLKIDEFSLKSADSGHVLEAVATLVSAVDSVGG